MTIVASEDSRNAAWASDKSGFGHKMLAKMGWSEGKGLGKNKQGQTHNLRAIRREDSLGIGASTDTHGSEGFSQTSANFHGVLAKLNAEHGNSGSSSGSGTSSDEDSGSASGRTSSKKSSKKDKKKKSSSKSSKKATKVEKKSKHRGKRDKDGKMSSDKRGSGGGITLAQNRVAAGHARKMRDAKDLSSKSDADMAAIFGVKVEHYRPPAIATIGATSGGDAASKKSKKKQKKKLKSKEKKKSKSSSSS
jgi:Pin2-interacting protein X1